MTLPLIPQDKANHIVYGAVIFALALFLLHQGHVPQARTVALALVAAIGALKEGADYLLNRRAIAAGLPPPHGVELLDFAATCAGGLVCYLASLG